MTALISEQEIGQSSDGQVIKEYRLRNARGTVATFINLGAAWVGFKRPEDADSLVLGCKTLAAFQQQGSSIGATAGRFANRIKAGQFLLAGNHIQLDQNDGNNHLHGGFKGFVKQVFESHIQLEENSQPTLTFRYRSPEGEGGFPGNVDVTVKIQLSDDDRVRFEYQATTDALSILNLTNHAYFNLNGQYSGSLHHHEVRIPADQVVKTDTQLIPTGELISVEHSALDLRQWRNIDTELSNLSDENLQEMGGYDHCFCFPFAREMRTMAEARSNKTNTLLKCAANLPGIQFYTSNSLGGEAYSDTEHFARYGAFCFEPGFWADSPNHPHFPDCTIDLDKPYSAIIEYTFLSLEER